MKKFKAGFIGCGNMASAIIKGILGHQILTEEEIFVFDTDEQKAQATGGRNCASIEELAQAADIIFLCVKPNIIPVVLPLIQAENKAFVSIAAGVKTEKLAKLLSVPARIMRIMPNTPLMVGKGASCVQTPNNFTKDESAFIEEIFSSLGIVEYVSGDWMDAVTGVSGSGPAYVYLFIDALAKAGEKNGLPFEVSLKLAVQTFEGACEMLKKAGDSPSQLIHNVCSPGGTTLEAMKVFDQNKTREIVAQAVDACVAKSKELSK